MTNPDEAVALGTAVETGDFLGDCPKWCNLHFGTNPRHHRSTRRQLVTGATDEAIELFGADHNRGIELFENGGSISLMGQAEASAVRTEYMANAAVLINAAVTLGEAIEEVWGS